MKNNKKIPAINLRQYGMIIALVLITLFFGTVTGGVLFKPMNISNIFMQNSYIIFLSIGMFFCVLTGNVDLSVGSVVGVSGALLGFMIVEHNVPTPVAVIVTLVCGLLIGVFHGCFIAFLNIPPFIVTLAGMLIFRGLTMVILQGQSLSPFSKSFQYFSSGFVGTDMKSGGINILAEQNKRKARIKYGFEVSSAKIMAAKLAAVLLAVGAILMGLGMYRAIPFILIILIIVALIYTYIADKTPVGRHVYAVGGNADAARLSGVKTRLIMFLVYVNCSFMATIAGIVVTSRLNVATSKAGTSYELDAIAACYIGGCAASGGAGSIIGVITGAAVMAVLNNGMSILGIGTDMQQVIKGFILLLAVTFDIRAKAKGKN